MVLRVNLIAAKAQPPGCANEAWKEIVKQGRMNRVPMIDAKHAIKQSRGAWQIEGPKVDKVQVNLDLEAMDDRSLALTAASVGMNLTGPGKKRLSRKAVIAAIEKKLGEVEFAPDDEGE